jgi:hemoglobin
VFTASDDEIGAFLESFYERVKADDLLGPFFNEVITNWPKHLRKIEVFWQSHLKEPGLYKGNPLEVHRRLHQRESFSEEQFIRWLEVFEEVAAGFFDGKNLKSIKQKARMIGGTLYGWLLEKELEVPGFNPFQA